MSPFCSSTQDGGRGALKKRAFTTLLERIAVWAANEMVASNEADLEYGFAVLDGLDRHAVDEMVHFQNLVPNGRKIRTVRSLGVAAFEEGIHRAVLVCVAINDRAARSTRPAFFGSPFKCTPRRIALSQHLIMSPDHNTRDQ